jgi:hypothetical protein
VLELAALGQSPERGGRDNTQFGFIEVKLNTEPVQYPGTNSKRQRSYQQSQAAYLECLPFRLKQSFVEGVSTEKL